LKSNANSIPISVFGVSKYFFGFKVSLLTGLLFPILSMATLVAQLNKIGFLISDSFPHSNNSLRALVTAAFSLAVASVSFLPRFPVDKINSSLTVAMVASFASLVAAAAAPSSGWTPSRLLLRTDLSALLPRRQGQGWAIPVFLQLLVYSEVVPLVCQRLGGDGAEVRRALFFGSLVPLAMCIVWTLVAVGLVPRR
jgi:amino acid permease